jgi:hypothetical protein
MGLQKSRLLPTRKRPDHEGNDLNVAAWFGWVVDPALEGVLTYERSVKEHPNPPAPNITLGSGRLTDILGRQLFAQTVACTVLDPDQ